MFKVYNFSFEESVSNTIDFLPDYQQDYFEETYEDPIIKLIWVLSFILALICGIALRILLWYESSGQAGQFRTMVNQLVSINLRLVLEIFTNPS